MTMRMLVEEMIAVHEPLGRAVLDARADPSKRGEVITLRKQYSTAVIAISEAIDRDDCFDSNPALREEFRKRFSQMRGRVAIFQAKWPASLLEGDPTFAEGAFELKVSNRDFITWARSALP